MPSFNGPGAFAKFLAERLASLPEAEHAALEHAAEIVRKEAVDSLGHYQAAAGPFSAWDPLSQQRQDRRAAAGMNPDDPLLATEELKESIGVRVDERTANIGSDLDKAVYMEKGVPSKNVPARSFLGRAGFVSEHKVVEELGKRIGGHLAGGE